jgi:benzoyl-CoA reductase/2-hydroxyglutaryl-CoA dehydratase subunit BcrC/BadD/HgdB
MAQYMSRNRAAISAQAMAEARSNNQVILTGVNEARLTEKGVFFVEFLAAAAGTTVAIADGEGRQIVAAVANFSNELSPLRCDYGITVTGNLSMLKGFIVEGVFE